MAELRAKHDVALEWLAFELRPEPAPLPDFSGPQRAVFREKWERGVAPMAARYGIEMHFPERKCRTRRAHAAMIHARTHADARVAEALRRALFRAYFVHDRDLDDLEVLRDIGASVGMDGAALRAALERGAHTEGVIAQERFAAELGVTAVPTIIIGTVGVQGAQPYDVLRQVYDEAKRRADAMPTATDGGVACSLEEPCD